MSKEVIYLQTDVLVDQYIDLFVVRGNSKGHSCTLDLLLNSLDHLNFDSSPKRTYCMQCLYIFTNSKFSFNVIYRFFEKFNMLLPSMK